MPRFILIAVTLLFSQTVQAISLSLNSAESIASEIEVSKIAGGISGLTLSLLNDSLDAVQIASAQFSIGVVPKIDLNGTVTITNVRKSTAPFFELSPMQIGPLGGFTTYTVSDIPTGPIPTGVVLNGESSGDIAAFDLSWSSNTFGRFEIVAMPINNGAPLASSHWINPSVAFVSQPFSNTELNSDGSILLGTLSIVSIPEPSSISLFLSSSIAFVGAYRRESRIGLFLR